MFATGRWSNPSRVDLLFLSVLVIGQRSNWVARMLPLWSGFMQSRKKRRTAHGPAQLSAPRSFSGAPARGGRALLRYELDGLTVMPRQW